MKKVLITGGTGLIGSHLVPILKENGFEPILLSRSNKSRLGCKTFVWDLEKGTIDEEAFSGVSAIIHLAGAGIGDKRWTASRKKVLMDSRVKSAALLLKYVIELDIKLDAFISASGISYYGTQISEKVYMEDDPAGNEFISEICIEWEKAAMAFSNICLVTILRTGIVLSDNGGALVKLAQPVKLGFGAPVGSGKQIMAYIHMEDLCRMYLQALKTEMQGTYNAVNGDNVTNAEFTKVLAKVLKKPLWLPNVPSFVLKLAFGEMASIVLGGSAISAKKIKKTNFQFTHESLEQTLRAIYN